MDYKSKIEQKRRDKLLYEETKGSCRAGVWYNKEKDRFIHYSVHNKFFKKYSRKKQRRFYKNIEENAPRAKSEYKKQYDYWWNVF